MGNLLGVEEREASDAAAGRAATRISFHLTYAHTIQPRQFAVGEMSGPMIPCAYGGHDASGDWNDIDDGKTRTELEWLDRFARYAINETVHEGLEHYRVDGRPWLDPHGPAEQEIFTAVNRLHEDLMAIRRRHSS